MGTGLSTGALAPEERDEPASPTVGQLAEGEVDPVEPERPPEVPSIGEDQARSQSKESLFDATAAGRIAVLWVLTPTIALVCSYALFSVIL